MPRWHPISISGYHIREAGSTAAAGARVHAQGRLHLRRAGAIERGLDVDDFAPRLSFFFNAHIDFFEEIAKYRAARRIWARELRDTYGARDERSLLMRFHTPDGGRVADRAAAAQQHRAHGDRGAVGGARRHPVAAHQLASTRRSRCRPRRRCGVALRTQQIIAHETGVTNTIDPLGGSYFVEALTDRMEEAAYDVLRARSTSSAGWSRRSSRTTRSARSPTRRSSYQEEVERGERIIVGVNRYQQEDDGDRRDPAHRPGARAQADRPRCRRSARGATPTRSRAALDRAARGGGRPTAT